MRLDSLGNRFARNVKFYPPDCPWPTLILVCACLMAFPSVTVHAATFDDLYTISVAPDPAARNLQEERSDAIRRAMGLLLTRITGRQQAAAYPEMRQLIDNAERYIERYAPMITGEIRIGFSESQLNQELTRLNMPIWGDERPLTLLWVATDFGDGWRAELKAANGPNAIRGGAVAGIASNPLPDEHAQLFDTVVAEMLTAADERGLPLILPLLDAEDRRHVRFADVWGGFEPLVARAAERYSVDAIVVARVTQTDFGPEVDWTVQRGDRRQTLTGPRVREGINWLADEFASEFTTVGDARLIRITVTEIRQWTDYRVIEYLKSISIVESVQLESIADGAMVLRVAARGDDSQLDRYLRLDGELLPVESIDGLVYLPSWAASGEVVDAP